jgi:mxaJ protein
VRRTLLAAVLALLTGALATGADALRVCADPNNLPFSNAQEEGFENVLARLVAREFGQRLEYTWWPQRRGFVRHTLDAGTCDVIMGVPRGLDRVATTDPYYRSSYVFVTRRSRALRLRSLDDPRLRQLRIGVQMIGDDFANSPPAHALSARGIVANIVGYSVLGDYSQPNPPARIVEAVAAREVDTALVWGPLAGFFAARAAEPLDVQPIADSQWAPGLPFAFEISMAVRRGDDRLRARLDDVISRRQVEIDGILGRFSVPRVSAAPDRKAGS